MTGADRQVAQRCKSAEASRKEETYTTDGHLSESGKPDVGVNFPPSNPIQETESSLELSRMSIVSSDCVPLPIVPVDQRVEAEKLKVNPYICTCMCVCVCNIMLRISG